MASLYDLLCYYSLTSTDPLLEELIAYLPTRFHSHNFDYIAYEHCSDDESFYRFFDFCILFRRFNLLFLKLLYPFLFFLWNSKNFLPQRQVQDHIKRPPAESDRRPVPALGKLVFFPKASAFGKGFFPLSTLRGRPLIHLSEK